MVSGGGNRPRKLGGKRYCGERQYPMKLGGKDTAVTVSGLRGCYLVLHSRILFQWCVATRKPRSKNLEGKGGVTDLYLRLCRGHTTASVFRSIFLVCCSDFCSAFLEWFANRKFGGNRYWGERLSPFTCAQVLIMLGKVWPTGW